MKAFQVLSFVTLLSSPLVAHAGFKGDIKFSREEVIYHQEHVKEIAEESSACLQQSLARQRSFYEKYGIAAYYGDRSSFSKLSERNKRAELRALRKDPDLVKEMKPTSCIGLALECLGRGFAKVKQDVVWKRIRDYTILNDVDGMALQAALQKMGWKVLYWNADPTQNEAWDKSEKKADPENKTYFAGDHAENYASVLRRERYFYTHVDDTELLRNLTLYNKPGARWPSSFLKVPFFVGIAHMGWHVFPGFTGAQIIEAHSTRKITDSRTIESSAFNPLGGGSPNGAPTGQAYRSGMVAIPPGY